MKHNLKITAIIIIMFLLTQLIGLYVVSHYSTTRIIDGEKTNITAPGLPLGLEQPEIEKESDFLFYFPVIIVAFVIAIAILFLLSKFKVEFFLKAWFFVVIVIALTIFFNTFLNKSSYSTLIALAIALPLAFIKIYRQNFLIHNLTELMVYPGIAVIFVPILNFYTIIALLILISIYDIWAVWHSGIMQKMARYQIDKLKIFNGFFIPYVSKSVRAKIKKMKKSDLKKKKFRMNVAVLGGGDVIFPIITAGVVLKSKIGMPFGLPDFMGGLWPAVFVILGATLGLTYLLTFSEKKKFYPAMPFITAGIFLGLIVSYLVL